VGGNFRADFLEKKNPRKKIGINGQKQFEIAASRSRSCKQQEETLAVSWPIIIMRN
jgi:hypothetical protein